MEHDFCSTGSVCLQEGGWCGVRGYLEQRYGERSRVARLDGDNSRRGQKWVLLNPEGVWFILRGKGGRHLCTVLKKDIGAQSRWQKKQVGTFMHVLRLYQILALQYWQASTAFAIVSHPNHIHLHRLEDNNVEYGHYEDQPAEVQESRLYHDMRNHPHHCSGYRVIHWNPNLAHNSIHLQPSSMNTIIRILVVISYFTARAVRLDEESSKLLILAPQNDTIDDLEGKLGAPAPNYPPTLFDVYLVCIYRRFYLPTNCDKFQCTNSQGNTVTPVPQGVSTVDVHRYITGNAALQADLQSRASISLIVELATSYPRGFATYCTVSNTVRAIGIGS